MGLGKLFGALMTAPESTTTQANQALEALAAQIRSDPQLTDRFQKTPPDQLLDSLSGIPAGREFLNNFQSFLDRFGHREVVLSSVLQPTWKDSPEVVLELIRGLSRAGVQQDKREKSWEAARDQLMRQTLMRLPGMQRWIMKMVATARSLWQVREDTHFEATRILPILRRIFLELGERLVRIGVCSTAAEVFHLTWSDLQRVDGTWPPSQEMAAELHNFIQFRKRKRLALEAVPIIDPRLYQPASPNREALLTGMPGSPGSVEGPVRVIHSANEFSRLQPGEILVAPYTNPAWTPLFQRAAAVVVDGGSAGSHAAIVAREYGIPAVMGTIMGTQKLVDGQRIRVDGSGGFVYAAENKSEL
jgi:pyruvate,water dikinase